jgi:hypothetical protein
MVKAPDADINGWSPGWQSMLMAMLRPDQCLNSCQLV